MQGLIQHHKTGRGTTTTEVTKMDQEFSTDVILGKGGDLVILLHGILRLGKTSTAERAAVQIRRPVFHITCGDIDTTRGQVEERSNGYFDVAYK